MSTLTVTRQPCAKCPFRKDVPIYLRTERRSEIAEALTDGASFPCHGTVHWDEDEDGEEYADDSGSLVCAGAVKALDAVGGSMQFVRVAERLGMVDTDAVVAAGADVWDLDDWVLLAEGATTNNPEFVEYRTCSVVDDGCLAPAGHLGGSGGVVHGTEEVDLDEDCPECGEPVCSSCSQDGVCNSCGGFGEWGDGS